MTLLTWFYMKLEEKLHAKELETDKMQTISQVLKSASDSLSIHEEACILDYPVAD